MKNILFIGFSSTNIVLSAIEFELFERYKHEKLFVLSCDGALNGCTQNLNNYKGRCEYCKYLSKKRLSNVKSQFNFVEIILSNYVSDECIFIDKNIIKTREDICEFTYDETLDCGMEVVSTLISGTNNIEIDINKNIDYLVEMLRTSIKTYNALIEVLSRFSISLVVLPNGRTLPRRAVLRACQRMNIDCLVFDGGLERYQVAKNCMLHDRDYILACIDDIWDKHVGSDGLMTMIDEFYRQNKFGNIFVKKQKKVLAPVCWDSKKKNICIFTSSDFEFAAIKNSVERVGVYSSQLDAIAEISKSLLGEDIDIYVRVHPNSINSKNGVISQSLFDLDNVVVIDPCSAVDTYWLIDNSDIVITFGSTVGIESVYYGKPVILIGDSFYCADDMYIPDSHEELIDFILQPLVAKTKLSSYKYAIYRTKHGVQFNKSIYYSGNRFIEMEIPLWMRTYCKALNLFDLIWRNFRCFIKLNKYRNV